MHAFSDYWLRTSAVIHVYKAWASGGTVQDVYFSLHTVETSYSVYAYLIRVRALYDVTQPKNSLLYKHL